MIYPKSIMPNWEELKPSIVFQCEDTEETVRKLPSKGVEVSEKIIEMRRGRQNPTSPQNLAIVREQQDAIGSLQKVRTTTKSIATEVSH